MAANDYLQNYSWSSLSPMDSSGTHRTVFKSAYKNLRFVLELQSIKVLDDSEASNLPGVSFQIYGTVDFWRVLLAYNGLQDPVQDVYAGQTFKIPTRNSIVNWLTQQQNNTEQVLEI